MTSMDFSEITVTQFMQCFTSQMPANFSNQTIRSIIDSCIESRTEFTVNGTCCDSNTKGIISMDSDNEVNSIKFSNASFNMRYFLSFVQNLVSAGTAISKSDYITTIFAVINTIRITKNMFTIKIERFDARVLSWLQQYASENIGVLEDKLVAWVLAHKDLPEWTDTITGESIYSSINKLSKIGTLEIIGGAIIIRERIKL